MPYKDVTQQKRAQHESYIRNKEKVATATKKSREERRRFMYELKEANPCMDCGISYPYYVMQFDHRDSSEKTAGVGILANSSSRQSVIDEIAKCDIVCANCHAIRSFKRLGVNPKI